jgi:hypothetical protein
MASNQSANSVSQTSLTDTCSDAHVGYNLETVSSSVLASKCAPPRRPSDAMPPKADRSRLGAQIPTLSRTI